MNAEDSVLYMLSYKQSQDPHFQRILWIPCFSKVRILPLISVKHQS